MTRLSRGALWRSMLHGSCATAVGATALALGVAAYAPPAQAQDASDDRVTRLVQLLIQKGILSSGQATSLLQETQGRPAARRAAPRAAATTAPAATAEAPSGPPGSVHVTYVPQMVRDQIAAEVKQQVMQEAQDQGWAAPNVIPGWTQHIRISGDVRVRGALDMLPKTNDPFLSNYNAINGSSNGYDYSAFDSNGIFPPLLNTTENRTQFQLRARLDVAAQLADWIDTDLRIATGNSNSPVSTNQTLGAAPGDFSKYSLWLDRASISLHPTDWMTITAGRAADPFWVSDLVFDSDLNFDGVSAQFHHRLAGPVDGFLTLGAFPVFNTDFNFGSTNVQKTASHDAYLFAIQGGADWKINDDYTAKLGLAYFDFSNIRGKTSSPCFDPTSAGSCDTDDTKPGFLQFGNTLFPIRSIIQDPSGGVTATPEFFGLASNFNILDVHASFTLANFHPIDIVLEGEYVKNLGYNRRAIVALGPVTNLDTNNNYKGGDTGYMIGATVGHQDLDKLWDWNVSVAYKYLESDAVLDAFTDSDFHLGGTNAKGYVLNGNLALTRNAWLSAKWLSTNQISGPPYAADVLLVDLNAKF